MRLYSNRGKAVGLFLDNLVRGTVRVQITEVPPLGFNSFTRDNLLTAMRRFRSLDDDLEQYGDDPQPEELVISYFETVDEIYDLLEEGRLSGRIDGEIKDFALEERVKELEKDNKRLASELANVRKELDLYKPPAENKNFRGVS